MYDSVNTALLGKLFFYTDFALSSCTDDYAHTYDIFSTYWE